MFALIGILIIGLCLGLLGSGGSILTVPVLIYLFDRPEKMAIAEALVIVGTVSLMGSIPYALRKEIDLKTVLLFGLPGMAGAFLGGCCSNFISSPLQLSLFAITMVGVSGLILFGPNSLAQLIPGNASNWAAISKGFLIGGLTGLLGVGGGFLIVPSLILLCNLPMTMAVGTSLVIIAMNSLIGFTERLIYIHEIHLQVNWQVIGIVSSIEILGCLFGGVFSKYISQIKLRKILGVTILFMGLSILLREI